MEKPEWYPYEQRYKYPGMSAEDKAIWERFIDGNPNAFDECAYNLAIGGGAEFDTTVNQESGASVGRLYQRKIDVLARKGNAYTVIEIGPRAATAKIGQVKGYGALLMRELPKDSTLEKVVLTDIKLPDMDFIAAQDGVKIVIA